MMMTTVTRKFTDDYQIPGIEAVPFGTERFQLELDRLEESCARNFKGTSSLVFKRRATLGGLFFDTVALKVIRPEMGQGTEIADREVRTWMNGFIRPLDTRINDYQEQANQRIEGMGRIQNAESDLMARLEELRKIAHDIAAPISLPPFDNSAVDGYAVRHADIDAKSETTLAIVDRQGLAVTGWRSGLRPSRCSNPPR